MGVHLSLVDLVDAVITLAIVELVLLGVYRHVTGRGIAIRDLAANMLAGLALMFALRSVVTDAGTVTTCAWLMAAGIAHGADILMRWRRSASRPHGDRATA